MSEISNSLFSSCFLFLFFYLGQSDLSLYRIRYLWMYTCDKIQYLAIDFKSSKLYMYQFQDE